MHEEYCNYFIIPGPLSACVSVTTCGLARDALNLLRERKDGFDIVISDVNMPDMDGFKLLEHVGLEMDLPVISQFSVIDIWNFVLFICCRFKMLILILFYGIHSDVC